MAERKKRGTVVEEPVVEETTVVDETAAAETNTTEGNIDELVAVVEDLNSVLGLDPPLPTEGEYDELLAAVTESAKEVLAEDHKALLPETWAFLQAGGMLGHLPAPKASKAEKPAKVEKPAKEKKERKAPPSKYDGVEKDEFGFHVGTQNSLFVEALRKAGTAGLTMAEAKAQDWNPTKGTFYNAWKAIEASGKGKKDGSKMILVSK